jgi:hypothetical protein
MSREMPAVAGAFLGFMRVAVVPNPVGLTVLATLAE